MTSVELTYHVPSIGTARTTLRDESADLYRLLLVAGEVERLKRLDHLGLVRAVWDGAHHPRWEYVVSILNLIEHCRAVHEVHLSAALDEPRKGIQISSGYELLRAWALLLNIGHLEWTFAAERALLLELGRPRTDARREFIAALDETDLRAWAEGILDRADVYQFFQALAYIRLDTLTGRAPDADAGRWRALLRLYVLEPGSERIAYLQSVYRNLRRIAYLALDTHYTPSVVNVNLGQILSDPVALGGVALRSGDELRVLEQQLTRDVYLSADVLEAVAEREQSLREAVRTSIRADGVRPTIESLADGRLQADVNVEALETVVRLPAWVPGPFDDILLERINVREEQESSERDLAIRNSDARLIWWAAPYSKQWVLQTLAAPSLASRAASYDFAFTEVARRRQRIVARYGDSLPERVVQRALFEPIAAELITAALRMVFARAVRWEWQSAPAEGRAWLTTRREAGRLLDTLTATSPGARPDELRSLRQVLPGGPDTMVALAVGQLIAYEPEAPSQVAEIDGVAVQSDGLGVVTVVLVEAKRQRSGAQTAAQRQLRRRLANLRPREGVQASEPVMDREGSLGYASARLTASV